MKVIIYLGVNSDTEEVTLSFPETKRLPKEIAKKVIEHIKSTDYVVISTCNESVINLIGELIFKKILNHKDVTIIYKDKEYFYDADGYLNGNWPYGVFSYGNVEEYL